MNYISQLRGNLHIHDTAWRLEVLDGENITTQEGSWGTGVPRGMGVSPHHPLFFAGPQEAARTGYLNRYLFFLGKPHGR